MKNSPQETSPALDLPQSPPFPPQQGIAFGCRGRRGLNPQGILSPAPDPAAESARSPRSKRIHENTFWGESRGSTLRGFSPDSLPAAESALSPATGQLSQEHPLVAPHVMHFRQLPFRTRVNEPQSLHASPSYPLARASSICESRGGGTCVMEAAEVRAGFLP